MSRNIRIDELENEINEILEEYKDEVTDSTKEVVDEVSKEAYKIVKEKAPVEARNSKRKGKYKKSLRVKTIVESLTEKKNVIYASGKEYRLTHLLENGHQLIKGGRTKKIPHFKYGNDYVQKNLLKRIKDKIKNIK